MLGDPGKASFIVRSVDAAKSLSRFGFVAPAGVVFDTPPTAASGEIYSNPSPGSPHGYHAILAFERQSTAYEVKLLDESGGLVHRWPVFAGDVAAASLVTPHGFVILPDGSLIANSGMGGTGGFLVKFDRCGNELWRRDEPFHHLMSFDDDGFLWTWRGADSAYSPVQEIVRIDPETGETASSISLNKEIFGDPVDQLAFLGMPMAGPENGGDSEADIFHPNDVEVLSAEMAPYFPMFEMGDILISLRNLNMIAVIDRRTHKIKWSAQGPWRRQHDPDFMTTGEISLFNNNFVAHGERIVDRELSSVLAVNPGTGRVRTVLGPKKLRFYSKEMGAHRWISDNLLEVVAPFEGRVLIYDLKRKKKVFAFNNRLDDTASAHVAMADWLPEGFFNRPPSAFFQCPAGAVASL
ncbi:MAG: arylsulfotransferase family protein [Parvularculaceae bacterium]